MGLLDLDAIEAREKAATPGPWTGDRYDGTVKYRMLGPDDVTIVNGVTNAAGEVYGFQREEDETFVMAARADIPALIAESRALRAEVATRKAELERLREAEQAGFMLSTWAASIHWREWETNTDEWLNGLRERIDTVQGLHLKIPLPAPPEVKP